MVTTVAMAEVRRRLRAFAHTFKDATREKQQAAVFWTRFYDCYGIRAESATIFEEQVQKLSGATGYIDSFIPGLLIVEHKSEGENLDVAYDQAVTYFIALPEAERPRYIITSDFQRFQLYDLLTRKHVRCSLADLPNKAQWFKFLLEQGEAEIEEEQPINRKAAYAVSGLHEALLRARFIGRDLEVFLTRLLFCMFADDTGIWGDNHLFRRLVERTADDGSTLGPRLATLFDVLDTPIESRQRTLDEELLAFPYVNGQLFSARAHSIPAFDYELRKRLVDCAILDWAKISPAIFGAMFQGVLEAHSPDAKRQATRRELGAHYTSERNILRVINPLFMQDLWGEFEGARRSKKRLQELHDKLANLKFLDPACGCGNFLVIAYRELRRLEMEVAAELFDVKSKWLEMIDVAKVCRVSVDQFFGIEIDEAAVHIARVALYITDHQLNLEAAQRLGNTRATVPLIHTPHIHCGNALHADWNAVLPAAECSYVISNPPFVGKQHQSLQQKADLKKVAANVKGYGLLDYVAGWYFKAAEYIDGTAIEVALVSTNSIAQGEQVALLWEGLRRYRLTINFAHRTFRWSNEGKGVAAVHCVIVGFSQVVRAKKYLFVYDTSIDADATRFEVARINPYLVDANWIVLEHRRTPLCRVPAMTFGSMANDGGHLLLTADERNDLIRDCPSAETLIRPFVGASEFINNGERYCLWLKNVSPALLRSLAPVYRRIEGVRRYRLESNREMTRRLASTAALFGEDRQPDVDYLIVPRHSSEGRNYIPIAFADKRVVCGDANMLVASESKYVFALLNSSMHMAWVRTVCGRIKSDYRYSAQIVYNNFVWPEQVTTAQVNAVEASGQGILDARARYGGSSLADLYDPLTMPADLLKAHETNDKAVDRAYGYKGGNDDASRAAFLFKLYEQAASLLPSMSAPGKRRGAKLGRG